ncbi:MAG: mechanosensitive ion channel domain-containing protein [Pseudanabaenaceae cyanobacterium]
MQEFWQNLASWLDTPLLGLGSASLTLRGVIATGLVLVGTWLGARFLRGLVSRSLHRALSLERGPREAIASICYYLAWTIGSITALQTAGIDLSSLTVFAGVVGIGLGLGVQNLASNFVSGLVLLFEQTIRVGDYIELEGVAGTVEKISIRSTLVRTVDDTFVIVPNQYLIQHQTINWSYGSHQVRVHVEVGVAYGTDPLVLTEALLAAARSDPRVLLFPEPQVWLADFGDNSLNFRLLFWIDRPREAQPIRSALRFQIEREFRQRGIEIPFPQLDVHLRRSASPKDNETATGKLAPLPQPPDRLTAPPKVAVRPNRKSLRELLQRAPYFENCSEEELLSLVASGYRQNFSPQTYICREGEASETFYIILSGSAEVFLERTQQRIAVLSAGEFFGEMSVLLGLPRTASVKTLEETTVFVLARPHLQRLLENNARLSEEVAQKIAERQQILRELGILTEPSDSKEDTTPLEWVRQRLSLIFGLPIGR